MLELSDEGLKAIMTKILKRTIRNVKPMKKPSLNKVTEDIKGSQMEIWELKNVITTIETSTAEWRA